MFEGTCSQGSVSFNFITHLEATFSQKMSLGWNKEEAKCLSATTNAVHQVPEKTRPSLRFTDLAEDWVLVISGQINHARGACQKQETKDTGRQVPGGLCCPRKQQGCLRPDHREELKSLGTHWDMFLSLRNLAGDLPWGSLGVEVCSDQGGGGGHAHLNCLGAGMSLTSQPEREDAPRTGGLRCTLGITPAEPPEAAPSGIWTLWTWVSPCSRIFGGESGGY